MSYTITDHWLDGVTRKPDNLGPSLVEPDLLVVHYTVTTSGPATARDLADESQRASVHLVVDHDGSVIQQVPFDRVAWHAGKSTWGGRTTCSLFSIGIEVVNLGPLKKSGDGFVDVYGRPYKGPAPVEAKHKDPNCRYRFWEPYPEEQMQALLELGRLLVASYGLREIVGHDDIAPGRKIDPGPAFPMEDYRAAVMGPSLHEEQVA